MLNPESFMFGVGCVCVGMVCGASSNKDLFPLRVLIMI